MMLVYSERPDVIFCNGPGVCVPVVLSSIFLAFLGVHTRARIAYFESFTCVEHLSLSGRILLALADLFAVQWWGLFLALKHHSSVIFTGPINDRDPPSPKPLEPRSSSKLAVVTVGSTSFNALMHAVDSKDFFDALSSIGVEEVLIQRGRSDYVFRSVTATPLIVNVCDYRPFLKDDISRASLLISHAGAGTILEALGAGTRTIVVPNAMLMSNHQLQLAKALAERNLLVLVSPENLVDAVAGLSSERLVRFIPRNADAVREAVASLLE
jgi:UDP-N-acetylglucosamine transferase subunit ALG13